MYSKTGSFALNTGTGNQSVTGLGFKPKFIIFYGSNLTADGTAVNATINLGYAVSATLRAAMSGRGLDGADTTDASRATSNAKCLIMANFSDATILDADLVTMDTDGFTINITTTDGVAYILNYLAVGGSDITNATVVENVTKTSTGTQAYTGVGFKPDSIFILTSAGATIPLNSGTCLVGFGFGTATNQGAIGIRIGSTVATQITEKTQKTDKVIDESNGGVYFMSASLSSMDTDGFTLNFTTASATARKFMTLCIKGASMKIGAFNQSTSLGLQSVTTKSKPKGLLMASWGSATSTSILEDSRTSFGTVSGTANRAVVWAGDQDNVGIQESNSVLDTDESMIFYTHPSTLEAEGDLSAFTGNGFKINWTTVDATSREILYFTFADRTSSGGMLPLMHAG